MSNEAFIFHVRILSQELDGEAQVNEILSWRMSFRDPIGTPDPPPPPEHETVRWGFHKQSNSLMTMWIILFL